MPSRETCASLDWTKAIIVCTGYSSLEDLKATVPSYHKTIVSFCKLIGHDTTKIRFYSDKPAATEGERNRSDRDPNAFYCIFDHSHGASGKYPSDYDKPQISKGSADCDYHPTEEWKEDLEKFGREILFIVIPMCWSAESRKVLLLSDRIKHVYGPDPFEIDDGAFETDHRMGALDLHFEETLA